MGILMLLWTRLIERFYTNVNMDLLLKDSYNKIYNFS